jgi:hypothetical protein
MYGWSPDVRIDGGAVQAASELPLFGSVEF